MDDHHIAKICVKVTADGCGVALENALVTILDSDGHALVSALSGEDGFTPIMFALESEHPCEKHSVTTQIHLDGFLPLTLPSLAVISGYTYFLSAPLKRK